MTDAETGRAVRPISVIRHPIYSILLPVPVSCFIGVLLTDLIYIASDGNITWLAFSGWLLLAGLVFGLVAAIVLLIDFVREPGIRSTAGWAHLILFYVALLVELVSIFIHQRDGWTAVVPIGLALSIAGAVLILAAGWLRRPAMETAR